MTDAHHDIHVRDVTLIRGEILRFARLLLIGHLRWLTGEDRQGFPQSPQLAS